MANGEAEISPLLRKVAFFGAGAVGVFVVVKLMIEFASALKPLVLAAMFVACVEFYIDKAESGIKRCLGSGCRWWSGQISPKDLEEPLTAPEGSAVGRRSEPKDETLLRKCVECVARPLAVLVCLSALGVILAGLGAALVKAVAETDLTIYKKGFVQLEDSVRDLFMTRLSPALREWLAKQLAPMMDKIGGLVASALNAILDSGSGFFTELVMFLIYVLMWLLVPMRGRGGRRLFVIVRTFFALKAMCNACFATLTFVLLRWLQVDLAIVLALVSFILGFIPEVGAIVALALPVPLVLLDSRLDIAARGERLAWAVGGLLLIKFLVSNGLESIVMGRNPTLAGIKPTGSKHRGQDLEGTPPVDFEETHPVIILFAVVLLGEIWGATGMLVSVPMISMIRLAINLESRREAGSQAPRLESAYSSEGSW